jgi:hypothetical protein
MQEASNELGGAAEVRINYFRQFPSLVNGFATCFTIRRYGSHFSEILSS